MTDSLQPDLIALKKDLQNEISRQNWRAAYEQARDITAHYEQRPHPTPQEHDVYLDALVAELVALSYLPRRHLGDTIRIIRLSRSAYSRLRRSVDAGSVALEASRSAFWRAVIPFA